jgi:DNA adenine methylase
MTKAVEVELPLSVGHRRIQEPPPQLLKWIGNKQRFAAEIIDYFPARFGRYFEPFLGSGAVLGALAPTDGMASDIMPPLIEIWTTLRTRPVTLKRWYRDRWQRIKREGKAAVYESVRASYNKSPNGADLLYLSRACYGGVVRFRAKDGYMSTPCGIHNPIPPSSFDCRTDQWHDRTSGTQFRPADFAELIELARAGDVVYCDPPYHHTQSILYGAQMFSLGRLFEAIAAAKARGAYVALSIDGTKRTDEQAMSLPIPDGLFQREAFVNCGRSMLRRFQREGETLEDQVVTDRLLLTY